METTTAKIILVMEYDGTNYFGFQLQANRPDQPTIQSELERAIVRLTGEELRVVAASRTDTGVHAKGQVVSIRTKSSLSPWTFVSGLNHYLPEDISVTSAYKVDESFNVRTNAVNREYRYYILNRNTRSALKRHFAYQVVVPLNVDAMNRASQVMIGKHDFASFTCSLAGKIKTVKNVTDSKVEYQDDTIIFSITSNSFLPHQIRNTVGALIQVGSGKMNVSDFYDMMNAVQPGLAGQRAPAKGLFLMKVNYSKPFGEEN